MLGFYSSYILEAREIIFAPPSTSLSRARCRELGGKQRREQRA